jgi:cytochrome c oxidase subunit 4
MAASGHIASVRVYVAVFLTLMVLTALTVFVAFLDLGGWNTPIALTVAVTKATLVILYFMHLRDSPHLMRVVVVVGFAWLGVLIALTLSDVVTRGVLGVPGK